MNKMEYQKPWAEFVQFSNEDVITASGNEPVSCGQTSANQGCVYAGVGGFCIVLAGIDFSGCSKTWAREHCGTASKNHEKIDCSTGWSNWYSEP